MSKGARIKKREEIGVCWCGLWNKQTVVYLFTKANEQDINKK
jgi:hypothetical protein